MQFHDKQYLNLLDKTLHAGVPRTDRTGTGTSSLFVEQMRFDLSDGTIPLLTTKKMHIPSIIHELLWYISGNTNIKYLNDNGVRIWNEWADENGDLGPVYGEQMRAVKQVDSAYIDYLTDPPTPIIKYNIIDQLQNAIDDIMHNPSSRRIIVNSWNVAELDKMKLPPCHMTFQFYVDGDKLSCHLLQRSADVFLGVPFNIAQYSILTNIIAHLTRKVATEFVWTGIDVHLYNNHRDQAYEQLGREPYLSPKFHVNDYDDAIKNINEFRYEHFNIGDYNYHPSIKAPVAV